MWWRRKHEKKLGLERNHALKLDSSTLVLIAKCRPWSFYHWAFIMWQALELKLDPIEHSQPYNTISMKEKRCGKMQIAVQAWWGEASIQAVFLDV
jgi:hypothetical protein